jgi:hypothetical protein
LHLHWEFLPRLANPQDKTGRSSNDGITRCPFARDQEP